MPRVVINSMAELRIFQSKIKALKNTLPGLQKLAADKAANDILLEAIHKEMGQKDVSDKIIDATFIGKIQNLGSKIKIHVISNYVSDSGFDVSNAREEGTRQSNPVKPNNPDGALRIPLPGGGFIFRKISRPDGMPRLLIIERNIAKFRQAVTDAYQQNLAAAVGNFLGGQNGSR